MEQNTHIFSTMLNDVKDYPMTNSTEEVYNSIIKLSNVDLMQLFVALFGTDAQHIQMSRTWKSGQTHTEYIASKPDFQIVSCNRTMAQDAIDQQAWEEECAKQRDYYEETV
jgi:hypothetical protein